MNEFIFQALIVAFLVAQVIYLANWVFKVFLAMVGIPLSKDEDKKEEENLPSYTILCPMYDETEVVLDLIENLEKLDYPKEKLQVLLLLEEDDLNTRRFIKKHVSLPPHIQVVVVPKGGPKTKPNACNYGLEMATGEFVTIYDAEDRPEPDQLKKVVYNFRAREAVGDKVGAVQCRLGYFNENKNFLTKMFSMEYAVWFNYYLPALEVIGLAIPLGGTSNHFRTGLLRELGGWNPLNVTEDCELGLRLYSEGYLISVINSTTWEEACSKTVPWIKQRTRWTKGYIQTSVDYLIGGVRLKLKHKIGAWLFIMGTPVFNLLYIPVNLLYFLHMPEFFQGLAGQLACLNMYFGITSLALIHALSRRSLWGILIPVYWLLHSVAAFRALWQYFTNRSLWEKTPHGLK